MCGIAGFLDYNSKPASAEVLKKMAQSIRHRGPDAQGIWTKNGIGLAHTRLSILDLSEAGRQPMISNNQRFIMVYNGEVYNFKEIRRDLEKRGHRFHSTSDSEVVLESFSEWGLDCLPLFNGMFAFAIWDQLDETLTIARDRCGVKPLYYTEKSGAFIFGSEVKAILQSPLVSPNIDQEALIEYFTFQNIFSDRTLFEGIKLLPAGTSMTINSRFKAQKAREFWDFHFEEPGIQKSEQAYVEELDFLFQQAVQRQLVSDVDIGSYLSGGMDSGSITAMAAKKLPYIKTFTTGFDLSSASGIELGFDERAKAEAMSYLFKTEHYEMVLKSGDMERVMSRLVWHLEDPRVGQSYPNFYVAQLASKFVKVVLSGCGGDELFGGYPWRYFGVMDCKGFEDYTDRYYSYWQRLIPDAQASQFFSPISNTLKNFSTRDVFKNVFKHHPTGAQSFEDLIHSSLYFEAKTFLHGLLIVEDKLSLAHSLETRVPFLDNDLIDFAMRIPAHLKLGGLRNLNRQDENEVSKIKSSLSHSQDGKQILRKMMSRHIPKEVTERAKQGFSAPDASWFRGESIDYVKRTLGTKTAAIYNYLDADTVSGLLNEHFEGKSNRRLLIWSLLNVNEWLHLFQRDISKTWQSEPISYSSTVISGRA